MGWPELSGRRIAGHRERLGLTQVQLASRIGSSRTKIQSIERNRANPSMEEFKRLLMELTEGQLEPLLHQGLDDRGEYNDARYGHPDGPQRRFAGALADLRQYPERMQVDVRGGGDKVRGPVRPLRSPLRPDPSGA